MTGIKHRYHTSRSVLVSCCRANIQIHAETRISWCMSLVLLVIFMDRPAGVAR